MSEMKCHREVKGRGALYAKLESRLQQEKHWIPNKRRFMSLGNGEVSHNNRDNAVRGVLNLCRTFKMFPETYAMAVNFMDRFLSLVKVRSVHLHCVSISCLYIAVKLQEEQQYIPDIKHLLSASVKTELCTPCYSRSDLLRMERKVLDKLEWSLNPVTPLIMLELYFAISVAEGCLTPDEVPNDELTVLTEQLEVALTYSSVVAHRPSVIALALVSLRHSDCTIWTEKLLPNLLKQAQVSVDDYYYCEEMIEELMYAAEFDFEQIYNHPSDISVPFMKREVSNAASFASMSISQSSLSSEQSQEDTEDPGPKPSYASVVAKRSISESMMSMSL